MNQKISPVLPHIHPITLLIFLSQQNYSISLLWRNYLSPICTLCLIFIPPVLYTAREFYRTHPFLFYKTVASPPTHTYSRAKTLSRPFVIPLPELKKRSGYIIVTQCLVTFEFAFLVKHRIMEELQKKLVDRLWGPFQCTISTRVADASRLCCVTS